MHEEKRERETGWGAPLFLVLALAMTFAGCGDKAPSATDSPAPVTASAVPAASASPGASPGASPAPPPSSGRIAFFDARRALSQVGDGKKRLAAIAAWKNARQKELDAERRGLEGKLADYRKSAPQLEESERRSREEALLRGREQLREHAEKLEGELQKRQREALAELGEKMESVVAGLAEERRYTAIASLDRESVFFVAHDGDVTDEVIRRYEAKYASPASPASPPAAAGEASPSSPATSPASPGPR